MARTRTLLQLRTECRQRTEQEGSTFVSDAELTRYLNQSIAVLYGMLAQARGDAYYKDSYTTTTTPGNEKIALPADFFKLLQVRATVDGLVRILDPIDLAATADHLNAGTSGWSGSTPVVYDLAGSNLSLLPIPAAAYSVQVVYVPHATVLVADSDAFDGINGWEAWVVLDVCIAMLGKEESDTRDLRASRDTIEANIQALAGSRDEGTAWRVSYRWRSRGGPPVRGRGY